MEVFRWEQKYSVGIESIDIQHKEIFRIMERLFQALKEGVAQRLILEIIGDLETYTRDHFEYEETCFELYNLKGSIQHINEHSHFINKLENFKAEAIEGNLATSYELLHFLKSWINHHILFIDMGYSEHFKKNGMV